MPNLQSVLEQEGNVGGEEAKRSERRVSEREEKREEDSSVE
jgi:hypothetical protein